MNKISIFLLGVIPGVFWGTLYGLYDKTWIPSLMYMSSLLLILTILEFANGRNQNEKN